jgi:hypothetical protein
MHPVSRNCQRKQNHDPQNEQNRSDDLKHSHVALTVVSAGATGAAGGAATFRGITTWIDPPLSTPLSPFAETAVTAKQYIFPAVLAVVSV